MRSWDSMKSVDEHKNKKYSILSKFMYFCLVRSSWALVTLPYSYLFGINVVWYHSCVSHASVDLSSREDRWDDGETRAHPIRILHSCALHHRCDITRKPFDSRWLHILTQWTSVLHKRALFTHVLSHATSEKIRHLLKLFDKCQPSQFLQITWLLPVKYKIHNPFLNC